MSKVGLPSTIFTICTKLAILGGTEPLLEAPPSQGQLSSASKRAVPLGYMPGPNTGPWALLLTMFRAKRDRPVDASSSLAGCFPSYQYLS